MNPGVSIVSCIDYSAAKEGVKEAIQLIGGLCPIVSEGDRVLLKPNVLGARRPDEAVTTNPSIIAAMCELVKDVGGIPVIGDAAGMIHQGATAEAFRVSGIESVAKEYGAELVNFQTGGYAEVDVPNASYFPRIFVSNSVLEADVIISLPKLKTHELTYYTGAVKNMFGALPLKTRKEMHLLAEREKFGEAVIDLYSVAKPHLAVMDGVVGMEGNGPSHGSPVETGVIMASYDSVSLDVVASQLIGFETLSIPTTKSALERGYGSSSPEIVGLALDSVKLKYKASTGSIISRAPPAITRVFGKYFTIIPRIDDSKCTQCSACFRNCSAHAIEKVDDAFKVNSNKCILCYCCRELCPENAVGIEKSLLAKIITRK